MTTDNTQDTTTTSPAAEAKAEKKAAGAKLGKKKPAAKKAAPKKTAKPAKAKKAKGAAKEPKGPGALKEYAPNYVKDTEHKTPSGNTSVHCGDDVAKKLLGKELDDVYALAAKTLKAVDPDVTEKSLRAKYGHLNVGMQRMNLGNRIRGVVHAK